MAAVALGPGVPPLHARPEQGLGPAEGADALFVALSAGFTTLSHPLLYVKLLVQVRVDRPHPGSRGRLGPLPCIVVFGHIDSKRTTGPKGCEAGFENLEIWALAAKLGIYDPLGKATYSAFRCFT